MRGTRGLHRRWAIGLYLLLTSFLPACAGAAEAVPTAPPYPTLEGAQVAQGREIYRTTCAACHGPDAAGAPNWATPGPDRRYPPPPHDDQGHTWHHSDRVLYEIIRDGWRDPLHPDEPPRMPAFGERLTDGEIRAVIVYFKSLWSAENRLWQWEVTRQDGLPTPSPMP